MLPRATLGLRDHERVGPILVERKPRFPSEELIGARGQARGAG
jgi:hypothetical protein